MNARKSRAAVAALFESLGTAAIPFAVCLGVSGAALAADIQLQLGVPGTAAWKANCLAANPTPPQVPMGTSQFEECTGADIPSCMHRVDVSLAEFPDAVFADGSHAVFYVRGGSGPDANKWMIHLQGGGSCKSEQSCRMRWCGQQGDLPYTANKMSSDWNGDGVVDLFAHGRMEGLPDFEVTNQFANWSHVVVYYGSADGHRGQMSDVDLGAFRVDTQGHSILDAIRTMLRKQNPTPTWTAVGGYTVPDLDLATHIVFSGTSAGGGGAVANADWFLSAFPNSNNSLVVDASADVSDAQLVNNQVYADTNNDGIGDIRYDLYRQTVYAPSQYDLDSDVFYDESCRALYEPLGRLDRCNVLATDFLAQITTPTFLRVDVADNVKLDQYVDHPNDLGFGLLTGGMGGTPTDANDFARMMRASLREYYTAAATVTGVFGPRCGEHVGLEDRGAFAETQGPDTTDANPRALIASSFGTFRDALSTWLNVGGATRTPLRRLDTDAPNTHFSTCSSAQLFARWLDLKCYQPDAAARAQDLNRDVTLRHLNPVLANVPDHTVHLRRLEELCVPVRKNNVMPPDSVLNFVRFADFACYQVENGPQLNRTLVLSHINPVLARINPKPFPDETVVVGTSRQLCAAVAKNPSASPLPPKVLEFLRHLDLECFDIVGPQVTTPQPLRLGHLNPLLTSFPDELFSSFAPRRLCVPVSKQGNPTPPASILEWIRNVDIKKYEFAQAGPNLNVHLNLRQINPLFGNVPDVQVQTLAPVNVGLPVRKAQVPEQRVPVELGWPLGLLMSATLLGLGALGLRRNALKHRG